VATVEPAIPLRHGGAVIVRDDRGEELRPQRLLGAFAPVLVARRSADDKPAGQR
jgi:hypothetical protein